MSRSIPHDGMILPSSFPSGKAKLFVDFGNGKDYTCYAKVKFIHRQWWNPLRWIYGVGNYHKVISIEHV